MHLNNRCLPDIMDDIVNHGSHDAEEFPFAEEQQILRRLKVNKISTSIYFRVEFMGFKF